MNYLPSPFEISPEEFEVRQSFFEYGEEIEFDKMSVQDLSDLEQKTRQRAAEINLKLSKYTIINSQSVSQEAYLKDAIIGNLLQLARIEEVLQMHEAWENSIKKHDGIEI